MLLLLATVDKKYDTNENDNVDQVDDADIVDYLDGNNDNAPASGNEEAVSEMAKMSLGPAWRWGYL